MSTDFSSIDRLVEFGMGMSLAQQMVNTMNQTMNSMQVAGVNAGTTGQQACASQIKVPNQWYVAVDGKQAGPLTDMELKELVKSKKVEENTLVWRPGLTAWQLACNVPELNKFLLLNS